MRRFVFHSSVTVCVENTELAPIRLRHAVLPHVIDPHRTTAVRYETPSLRIGVRRCDGGALCRRRVCVQRYGGEQHLSQGDAAAGWAFGCVSACS